MELEQAILERRSVRTFRPESPSRELIREVIRLAAAAPSPMNRQDWHFSIARSPALRASIISAVEDRWDSLCAHTGGNETTIRAYQGHFSAFREAPVLVAVCVKRAAIFLEGLLGGRAERVQGDLLSAGMAVQNLLLASHAKGLGACVYTGCIAAEEELARIFHIGRTRRLACLVALGFPRETPPVPGRRDLEDIITWVEGQYENRDIQDAQDEKG